MLLYNSFHVWVVVYCEFWNLEARRGKKFAADIKEKRIYPKQSEIIEEGKRHFKRIIQLRKNEWIEEYWYWLERGWL